jgi:hypothetical protein
MLDIGLISVLLLMFCIRIWNTGIVHHDDAVWALATFQPDQDPAGGWARSHGRLYAFPYGVMMLHNLAWLGTVYGEMLRVGSFAVFFALFFVFVALYCGRRLALLWSCFFFAFFALRWEESCLTAGPLAPWVVGSAAVASVLLARAYARTGNSLLAVGAGLCLFASLFTNEAMSVCYCAFFLLAIIWLALGNIAAQPELRAWRSEFTRAGRTRTLLIALAIAVSCYAVLSIGWRLAYSSRYDGHVLAPFDPMRIATVLFQFATSNSILRDFFQPYSANFSDVLAGGGTQAVYAPSTFMRTLIWYPAAVMFGLIAAYHFFRATAARNIALPERLPAAASELFALLVGISFTILPILPPAATAKYQSWYDLGVTSFSTSIFAYFGLSLALAAVASLFMNALRSRLRPVLAIASALVVAVIAATSYRMNDAIALDMRLESGRWRVLALALESISAAHMEIAAIWAPRFKSGSWFTVVPASYWSQYAKARYHTDVRFLDALPPADRLTGVAYLDYVLADDDSSYITTLARLGPGEPTGMPKVSADMIAVHLERPSAAMLQNFRLSFLDAQGALRQIPLQKLTPRDRKGKLWTLEGISATPASIRITRQSFIEHDLRPCATAVTMQHTVHFGTNRAAKDWDCIGTAFLQSGWGTMEAGGVWSLGREARLSIATVGLAKANYALAFDLSTYAGMGFTQGTQTVRVFVNGHPTATWTFTTGLPAPDTRFIVRPELIDASGVLNVAFEVEPTMNPKALGIANDDRDLGITLRSVRIESARP